MNSKGTKEFLRFLLSVTVQTLVISVLLVGACFLVVSLGWIGFVFICFTCILCISSFFFFFSNLKKKFTFQAMLLYRSKLNFSKSKLLKITKYINAAFPTVKLCNRVYVGSQLWNCEQL